MSMFFTILVRSVYSFRIYSSVWSSTSSGPAPTSSSSSRKNSSKRSSSSSSMHRKQSSRKRKQSSSTTGTLADIELVQGVTSNGGGGGGGDDDEEKNAHPGPIFLANVVNRPFRYSWMVAAISLLVMMTIIVAVSVVYSNQS